MTATIDEDTRLDRARATAQQAGFRLQAGDKTREARFAATRSPQRLCMCCHKVKPLDAFDAREGDCVECKSDAPHYFAGSIAEATQIELEGIDVDDPLEVTES